jgi:hypothetical protein
MRLPVRGVAGRVAMIDAYQFPSSIHQRFAFAHESLSEQDIRTAEVAARQWFRLAARHPHAKLAMPSVAVDDLWHEMVLHTQEYAEFCDAALGRFLHHVPESAMSGADTAGNRHSALPSTLKLAQQDEACPADRLPLLFRVDRELRIENARHYLADCGGRGLCYGAPGMVCVQHLHDRGHPLGLGQGTGHSPDSDRRGEGAGMSGCAGA